MVYIKKINQKEKSKIESIRTIPEIQELSLPSIVIGRYLITPRAKTIRPRLRPRIEEMVELLKALYVFDQPRYSDGIYSFARKGRNNNDDEPYYAYIEREVNILLTETRVNEKLIDIYEMCLKQWRSAIEKYRGTQFDCYNVLHGDIHLGNIVRYKNKLKLIDWEYLRSGPKEMEIAFYLFWDHLNKDDISGDISFFNGELLYCVESQLINEQEANRIREMLIPMWIILCICGISNGKLLFQSDRIEMCNSWGQRYMEKQFLS